MTERTVTLVDQQLRNAAAQILDGVAGALTPSSPDRLVYEREGALEGRSWVVDGRAHGVEGPLLVAVIEGPPLSGRPASSVNDADRAAPITPGDVAARERRLQRAAERLLRRLSAEDTLVTIGHPHGFRLEDLVTLRLAGDTDTTGVDVDLEELVRTWWGRRLNADAGSEGRPQPVVVTDTAATGSTSVLVRRRRWSAVFSARGALSTSHRTVYQRNTAGRVHVEAFELHVTEHCNLRCAHCCNTSPYLDHKILSPAEIADTLRTMASAVHADVFKIMGGEPLLHPEITEVVRVVRDSGVGDVVRLFTNGLLLHKMDDGFWRSLDHLTVSSYASAPVRPEQVAMIEEKAARFDVVLNIKPVTVFSQVMNPSRQRDADAVKNTYQDCWLRHRCLVVRDGRFSACTRVAYLDDLHQRLVVADPLEDAAAARDADSVRIDSPTLAEDVLALLNRQQPFAACAFCLGGDGPREPHRQLSRDDVRAGRLRPSGSLPIVRSAS